LRLMRMRQPAHVCYHRGAAGGPAEASAVSYPEATAGRHRSPILDASRARPETPRPAGPRFPRQPRVLSAEIRQQAAERFNAQEFCQFCGGLHPGISTPACPRIASFDLNADGALCSAVFFASGDWDASEVIFSTDTEEPNEPAG
jgi:hypothetical protein